MDDIKKTKRILLKKMSERIEDIISNLIDIFSVYRKDKNEEYNELKDLLHVKKKMVDVTDAIMTIYQYIFQISCLKFSNKKLMIQDRDSNWDLEKEFEKTLKTIS